MTGSALAHLPDAVPPLLAFAVALALVAALTVLVARRAGLDLGWLPLRAITRAAVQLAVVASLLRLIVAVPWVVVGFVALMFGTASLTAAGRLRELYCGRRTAVLGVASGSAAALAVVFGLGLLDVEVRYVVAAGGIVIGNAMSAATLAGRNFLRASRTRRDEVEGWLALGASAPRAHLDLGREAAREALLPTLDQTRSTGLVTLPGAFVGALFGGASPVEAAQFQLVVLSSVALAMTVTAVLVVRLSGRTPYLAVDPA